MLPDEGCPGGLGLATVMTVIRRMTIFICLALPGGLGAQRNCCLLLRPNYTVRLDDEIK